MISLFQPTYLFIRDLRIIRCRTLQSKSGVDLFHKLLRFSGTLNLIGIYRCMNYRLFFPITVCLTTGFIASFVQKTNQQSNFRYLNKNWSKPCCFVTTKNFPANFVEVKLCSKKAFLNNKAKHHKYCKLRSCRKFMNCSQNFLDLKGDVQSY